MQHGRYAKKGEGDHERSFARMNTHMVAQVLKKVKRPLTLIFEAPRTVEETFEDDGKLGTPRTDAESCRGPASVRGPNAAHACPRAPSPQACRGSRTRRQSPS